MGAVTVLGYVVFRFCVFHNPLCERLIGFVFVGILSMYGRGVVCGLESGKVPTRLCGYEDGGGVVPWWSRLGCYTACNELRRSALYGSGCNELSAVSITWQRWVWRGISSGTVLAMPAVKLIYPRNLPDFGLGHVERHLRCVALIVGCYFESSYNVNFICSTWIYFYFCAVAGSQRPAVMEWTAGRDPSFFPLFTCFALPLCVFLDGSWRVSLCSCSSGNALSSRNSGSKFEQNAINIKETHL